MLTTEQLDAIEAKGASTSWATLPREEILGLVALARKGLEQEARSSEGSPAPLDVGELRRLYEAANLPGPFEFKDSGNPYSSEPYHVAAPGQRFAYGSFPDARVARFVAALVTAAPKILRRLEASEKLAEALRFYADPESWRCAPSSPSQMKTPVNDDYGDSARAALAAYEGSK
jgi:hypothetical protein